MLRVRRDTLARMLRSHGEDELADRALSVTHDELRRIGELGECYAFSERAMATGGSMGAREHSPWPTIDVLEGTPRDLRWPRSELEREMGDPTYQMPSSPETARFVSTASKSCSPIHTPDLATVQGQPLPRLLLARIGSALADYSSGRTAARAAVTALRLGDPGIDSRLAVRAAKRLSL